MRASTGCANRVRSDFAQRWGNFFHAQAHGGHRILVSVAPVVVTQADTPSNESYKKITPHPVGEMGGGTARQQPR